MQPEKFNKKSFAITGNFCYILWTMGEVMPPENERNTMSNDLPEIMTIEETAQYLRISSSSLYKYAQEGKIPCQKIGRHWRFRRQTLERWLDASPQPINSMKLDTVDQMGE
jgi:excisionase family DNA binding protein